MDVSTLDDALKLQAELASKLVQGLDAMRTRKGLSPDELLREMRVQLTAAQADLDTAVQERAEVAVRWDEVIARRKATVDSLAKDIAGLGQQPVPPVQPVQPVSPIEPVRPLQPVRPSVTPQPKTRTKGKRPRGNR
jgi:hypothetical protein